MINYRKAAIIAGSASLIAIGALGLTQTSFAKGIMHNGKAKFAGRGAIGTVTAVSGNSITLKARSGTVYTIDASSAKISKVVAGTTGTKPTVSTFAVSGIQDGDNLIVGGTVSGTTITAKTIIDGNFPKIMARATNAKRGVMGTVAGISGNTITVTGRNGKTYTVDATNAQVSQVSAATAGVKRTVNASSVSAIKTGDNILVAGTVSGTNVTATKIMDGVGFGRRRFRKNAKASSTSTSTIPATGTPNQ